LELLAGIWRGDYNDRHNYSQVLIMSDNAGWRTTLLERQHWVTFLLPFLVFMLAGTLEPTPTAPGGKAIGLAIPYSYYPWMYAARIALTVAAVVFVWPGYRKFPWRLSWTAIVVGLIGGPLWIGLAMPGWERLYVWPLLKQIGLGFLTGGDRAGFNPFDTANSLSTVAAWLFLAVRLLGLAAVVPVIEEFFLRGFMMRFVMERDWWEVPFGKASGLAIAVGTILPVLAHPEWIAAAVWFSMITWLMLRTRNIWDCVAAHAITNLILGIYVVIHGGEAWGLM
jgi:uncharacterized protein